MSHCFNSLIIRVGRIKEKGGGHDPPRFSFPCISRHRTVFRSEGSRPLETLNKVVEQRPKPNLFRGVRMSVWGHERHFGWLELDFLRCKPDFVGVTRQ